MASISPLLSSVRQLHEPARIFCQMRHSNTKVDDKMCPECSGARSVSPAAFAAKDHRLVVQLDDLSTRHRRRIVCSEPYSLTSVDNFESSQKLVRKTDKQWERALEFLVKG